jgi:hypothetical protein
MQPNCVLMVVNFSKIGRGLDRAKDLITFYLKENNENSGSDMSSYFYEIKGGNKNVISAKTTGQYVPKCLLTNIIAILKSNSNL